MIHIIDCGTSWLKQIEQSLADADLTSQVVELQQLPDYDFDNCSGVIVSGANIILTEIDQVEFLTMFEFIKTADFPILGICLGHQVLGLLYGADIARGPMIDKKESIEIVQSGGLFAGIANPAQFREEHSEFITLPPGFELLAFSSSCTNESMQHPTQAKFGVQFHPEVSGASGKKLIGNFLDLCTID